MGTPLPDKMFYKIGEVAKLAGVRTSVLRFWETEFKFLKPDKSTSGQRLYTKQDVEFVLLIRRLLYEEKLTIEGAKKRISSKAKSAHAAEAPLHVGQVDMGQLLRQIKTDLQQLRNMM